MKQIISPLWRKGIIWGDRMTNEQALDKLDKTVTGDLEWKIVVTKALEKQIPKKVVNIDDFADYAECPSCGAIATDNLGCLYGWCRKCGQKLKRSEEE